MTTIYNRNRGFAGVKLVADCSGKKKSCVKPSSSKKVGCGAAYFNMYIAGNPNDGSDINMASFNNYTALITGDRPYYDNRRCGFKYTEGEDYVRGFTVTNNYAGNYNFTVSLTGSASAAGVVMEFNVFVNDVLVENLTGLIVPVQSTTQSGNAILLSINGILKLKKDSEIRVSITSDANTSIFISKLNLTIESL